MAKATRQAATATAATVGKQSAPLPAQKKELQRRLTDCTELTEVLEAFESVFGTDWVTTVSRWSAAQLESVAGLLADHVDVPRILEAENPNDELVAALLSGRDMADSDEEERPPKPIAKNAKGMATERGDVGAPKKGAEGSGMAEALLKLAAVFKAEKNGASKSDDEEDELEEPENFMAKFLAALGGMDFAGGKAKKTKGVRLPARATCVTWKVAERMLLEVLEEANENGGGIRNWIMTTKAKGWRNEETRKVVLNLALVMDTLMKELGPAGKDLAGMEYLMRVIAALLQVEMQGAGGWKVAGHLLALREDASLVTNQAMKGAVKAALAMDKLGKAQQSK